MLTSYIHGLKGGCVVCCGSLPRLFPPPLFCLCHSPEAATANGCRQDLGSRDKNLQHGAHRVDNCTIQLRAQSPSQIQRELGNPTIVAAKALGFQLSYPSYHVKDTTCEIFTQVPNSAVISIYCKAVCDRSSGTLLTITSDARCPRPLCGRGYRHCWL